MLPEKIEERAFVYYKRNSLFFPVYFRFVSIALAT